MTAAASSRWADRRAPRVVAYVRTGADQTGEPSAPWRTPEARAHTAAIERWASAAGRVVVTTATDRAGAGLEHIADRVGFLKALEIVRDGRADAVCVDGLASLDPDMVIQELLLDEARRVGVKVVSAQPQDDASLAETPDDERRALVRRVIRTMPAFLGELRSLRAWLRRSVYADELERMAPALADLDNVHGDEDRVVASVRIGIGHRIATRMRARRDGRTAV